MLKENHTISTVIQHYIMSLSLYLTSKWKFINIVIYQREWIELLWLLLYRLWELLLYGQTNQHLLTNQTEEFNSAAVSNTLWDILCVISRNASTCIVITMALNHTSLIRFCCVILSVYRLPCRGHLRHTAAFIHELDQCHDRDTVARSFPEQNILSLKHFTLSTKYINSSTVQE